MPNGNSSALQSDPWHKALRFHFMEISSTNEAAMSWLRDSRPSQIALFSAEHQTSGRGQHGRAWEHRANKDLAWSFAVHFEHPRNAREIEATFWFRLNMEISEAVKRFIEKCGGDDAPIQVGIKWPNDLYVRQTGSWKKCAGILLENHWKGQNLHGIVVGIGVNIAPFESATDWAALQSFSHHKLRIANYQNQLEKEFKTLFPLATLDFDSITPERFAAYQKTLYGWNEVLSFEWKGAINKARFLGVSHKGEAQLEWINGVHAGMTTSHFSAGDLRWMMPTE
jgi:biotin-[acetyl-CoA-carboxylase] ligase BirA-like protein